MQIDPPTLDHDIMMFNRYQRKISPVGKIDRRVVANMIHVLTLAGFQVSEVFDGDTRTEVSDMKAAMELIFNLDDCFVFFTSPSGSQHWVRLVMGNSGWDVINDYTCSGTFGATLDAFDGETYV